MEYTTNYNLKKPGATDYVNIGDLNDNADTIDTQLKALDDSKQDNMTAGVDYVAPEAGKGLFSGSYTDLTDKPSLGTAASKDTGTGAGNVPIIGQDGKLDNSIMPPLAIGEFIGTVSTKADLVTLSSAEKGDIARVSSDDDADNNGVYWLNGTYSTLSDWVQIVGPSNVISVNGSTGVVVLTLADLDDDALHRLVTDSQISTWDGKQNALVVGTNLDSAPTASSNNPVTSGGVATALEGKVDKVTGKGLSANDFTDTLKTKLEGIAEGAEVNVNADWNASSGDAQILNKPTIPDELADLTSDATHRVVTDTQIEIWNGKQDVLVFDEAPVSMSNNPVTSGGVYAALQEMAVGYIIEATVSLTAGTGVDGFTVTATASGYDTLSGTTDANGFAQLTGAKLGVAYNVTATKSGYATQSETVRIEHLVNEVSISTYQHGKIRVTVVDPKKHSSIGVSATNGTETVTGTVDASSGSGDTVLTVSNEGAYTVSVTAPSSGTVSGTATVTTENGTTVDASAISIKYHWTFGMSFDSTTFQTDDSGCLAYTDDCQGFTPVSGPGSSLGACSTIGDWAYDDDGSSDNDMLLGIFYATFKDNGNGLVPYQKLNPNDLTQVIATYDESTKLWTPASGTSDIGTYDTMLCIPTTYKAATASRIALSSRSSEGTALAHVIGGHTYEYIAIGVYEGSVSDSKLMSVSGVASTASTTRPTFRGYADSKTVKNGHAMLWNYYQWDLWRLLVLFACKRWNAQAGIGQGGFTYNGTTGQGLCNAMGPWAGDSSASVSESKSVKALIENGWGYKWEFIDDFYAYAGEHYAGQNAVPTDDSSNKTLIITNSDSANKDGFANEVLTSLEAWGQPVPENLSGSSTTGNCDRHIFRGTSDETARLGIVGGSSYDVSGGRAGPGCLNANDALSISYASLGARLAFVFDL